MAGIKTVGILSLLCCLAIGISNLSIWLFDENLVSLYIVSPVELLLCVFITVLIPSLRNGTAVYQAGLFEEINRELNLFWFADILWALMLIGYRVSSILINVRSNPYNYVFVYILHPIYQIITFFYFTCILITILRFTNKKYYHI